MIIGIKNTIPTSNNLAPEWLPSDESTLVAWYKNGAGITLNGSDVSAWADSSSNSHDMVQATASEQPAYNASTGALTFDSTDSQSLASSSEIGGSNGLDEVGFIIAFRVNPIGSAKVILGHNSTPSEMVKIMNSTLIRVKPAGDNVNFDLESGHATSDDSVWIIVRKDNDDMSVYLSLIHI